MIIKYTTNKESLKKWLSENQEENPIIKTNIEYKETPPDLTQAAQLLFILHKSIKQEGATAP